MTTVRAKVDLRDATSNVLLVPADSVGTVVGFTIAPAEETWRVQFTVDQTTVTQWVTPSQNVFVDGPIGPLSAVLGTGTKQLSSVRYPRYISDTDIIIGDQLPKLRSVVEFVFTDGTVLTITSDQNTGEIHFEFTS